MPEVFLYFILLVILNVKAFRIKSYSMLVRIIVELQN
jgi:hypothetical protein